jgi:hypothetical protein
VLGKFIKEKLLSTPGFTSSNTLLTSYKTSLSASDYYKVVRSIDRLNEEMLWRERNEAVRGERVSEITIEEEEEEEEEEEGGGGDNGGYKGNREDCHSDRTHADPRDRVDSTSSQASTDSQRRKSFLKMSADLSSLTTQMTDLKSLSPMDAVRSGSMEGVLSMLRSLLYTYFSDVIQPNQPNKRDDAYNAQTNVLSLPSLPPLSNLLSLRDLCNDGNDGGSTFSFSKISYFHKSTYLYSTFPIERAVIHNINNSLPKTTHGYGNVDKASSDAVKSISVKPLGSLAYVVETIDGVCCANFCYCVNSYTCILTVPLQPLPPPSSFVAFASSLDKSPPSSYTSSSRVVPSGVSIHYINYTDSSSATTPMAVSEFSLECVFGDEGVDAGYRQIYFGNGMRSFYGRRNRDRVLLVVKQGGGMGKGGDIVQGVCM